MSKMIKIGTLTFFKAHNYGAVLQAYALQTYLNSLVNVENEIIDYYQEKVEKDNALFTKINSIRDLLKNLIIVFNYSEIKKRHNNFVSFQNKFKLSEKTYRNENDFKNLDNYYDIVICGSDQVWNENLKGFDMNYFFPYVSKAKKIAYAPSIGNCNLLESKNKEYIKHCLEKFDRLSVRELSGKAMIENLTSGCKVELNVDPTFLVNIDVYNTLCSPRIIKEDYIFFYSIGYNEQFAQMAEHIMKATNLKIYTLASSALLTYKYKKHGIKFLNTNSVGDFLSLIKYANLIISSSFHGSVFSIIFRKNFYCLYNIDGSNNRISESRMDTLLKNFQLEDRKLDLTNYKNVNLFASVIYNDLIIDDKINKSKVFLHKAIYD